MNDKPKTKWRWRLLRWGLIGLAVLSTLAAILITEENWRGKRAWENYKREAGARGERLDLAPVIPPPVPDDQNFYSAPIVASALNWNRNQNTGALEQSADHVVNRMNFIIYRGNPENWPPDSGNWQKGKLTDLKQWQRYFRAFAETPQGKTNGFPVASQPQTPATDILLALSCFDPAIKELREALQRPCSRYPLDYESGFDVVGELLPYLANVKRCGQLFQLRILAELDNGQSEKALDDVKLLLGVTDSIRDQPFLISHLVRIAMLAITLQPVYEGLAQQRWSEAQLMELERALAKLDFLADFQLAMKGEKIFAIESVEKQRITREYKTVDDSSGTNKIITVSLRLTPSAYFFQNELAFARMCQQWILPLVDAETRVVSPDGLRRADQAVRAEMKHYSPYKIQALMTFPALNAAVKKFAFAQASVDLARVACALERYRLANGKYPEMLDALVPQFIEKLPHDIINGQPLHYRRTDDPPSQGSGAAGGKFLLYSVGWNETDDGGQVAFTKSGSVDREKGDWVWRYPAK
ncbi:MAG: hypothetical protein ACLPYZ_13545 [Limisphaerales bacterium]